jgi:hypothetical protein
VTYRTPGEQEAELASAIEAVIDSGESRLAEVYAMNRRVRDRLVLLINDMWLALDDGDADVMRDALRRSLTVLAGLADDGTTGRTPMLVVEWSDKT